MKFINNSNTYIKKIKIKLKIHKKIAEKTQNS